MSRRQLIAPFLAGVFLGPPITLLLGFGWELLLISPLVGGVSFAAAAARAHYATNFFRSLIPQPDLASRRAEVEEAAPGFPTLLNAARHVVFDLRFALGSGLIVAVALLLLMQGAPVWQGLLLAVGGPTLIALAMTRRLLS